MTSARRRVAQLANSPDKFRIPGNQAATSGRHPATRNTQNQQEALRNVGHNIQSEALDVQGILDEYLHMDLLRDLLVPSLVQPSGDSSRLAYEFYSGDMIERLAQGQPIYR